MFMGLRKYGRTWKAAACALLLLAAGTASAVDVRIATMNVCNLSKGGNATLGAFSNIVKRIQPDVLALQEVSSSQEATLTALFATMPKPLPYRAFMQNPGTGRTTASVDKVAIFSVWPITGAEIVKEFTAPAQAVSRKLVWKTENPTADCVFRCGAKGAAKSPAKDGFFEVKKGPAMLHFPDGVWEGPAGARFMLTFDMQTIQEKRPCWSVALRNLKPTPGRGQVKALKDAAKRMYTVPGDSGLLRYVVEFEKPAAVCTYALLLNGETPGKVRFTYAKIERLGKAAK